MTVGDIYKTTDIVKVSKGDSLASALNSLTSSHDSAFVFDNDAFLGVITPFFAAIRSHHPPATKVENALVHPPRVEVTDDVSDVARLMMESKMHFLPVFEKNTFLGVVSARRILSRLAHDPVFKVSLRSTIGAKQQLITVSVDDPITKVLHLFKEHNVSKLVVVAPDMKLAGIIAQYDVINLLTTPKDRQTYGVLGGEKVSHTAVHVKNLYKSNVLTVDGEDSYEKAVQRIIEHNKGSVVVVDANNIPIEIVTISDLLRRLVPVPNSIPLDTRIINLEEDDKADFERFLDNLTGKLKHTAHLKKVIVTIDQHKHGGVVEIKLQLQHEGLKDVILDKSGKNLKDVVGAILEAVNTLESKQ